MLSSCKYEFSTTKSIFELSSSRVGTAALINIHIYIILGMPTHNITNIIFYLYIAVVCWDINEVTAEETASEIRNQGGQAWSFKCDVSDKVEVAYAAKKTRYVSSNLQL